MRIEGDVGLDIMVWLSQSPEAALVRGLGRAVPGAEWTSTFHDRVRARVRGGTVDLESQLDRRWTGLVTGRVVLDTPATDPGFRPYVQELPPAPLALASCWFAIDLDGKVACFDRDQLGAAPMRRCWGPRPAPPPRNLDARSWIETVTGRHVDIHAAARPYTFTADGSALLRGLAQTQPQSMARRWSVLVDGTDVIVTSSAMSTAIAEPVPATVIAWLHAHGLCRGCARASVRDPRVSGLYVYQHDGRARAAPYERVSDPLVDWSIDEAAVALGLQTDALMRSALPVRFAEKDRLQPIEYVACTWSETVPWESEAGERHGADAGRAR